MLRYIKELKIIIKKQLTGYLIIGKNIFLYLKLMIKQEKIFMMK